MTESNNLLLWKVKKNDNQNRVLLVIFVTRIKDALGIVKLENFGFLLLLHGSLPIFVM